MRISDFVYKRLYTKSEIRMNVGRNTRKIRVPPSSDVVRGHVPPPIRAQGGGGDGPPPISSYWEKMALPCRTFAQKFPKNGSYEMAFFKISEHFYKKSPFFVKIFCLRRY